MTEPSSKSEVRCAYFDPKALIREVCSELKNHYRHGTGVGQHLFEPQPPVSAPERCPDLTPEEALVEAKNRWPYIYHIYLHDGGFPKLTPTHRVLGHKVENGPMYEGQGYSFREAFANADKGISHDR